MKKYEIHTQKSGASMCAHSKECEDGTERNHHQPRKPGRSDTRNEADGKCAKVKNGTNVEI